MPPLAASVLVFALQQPPPVPAAATQPPPLRPPTRTDILRGEYGRYRANNDLLFYHPDIRVDPAKKSVSGRNTIRFKMLRTTRGSSSISTRISTSTGSCSARLR